MCLADGFWERAGDEAQGQWNFSLQVYNVSVTTCIPCPSRKELDENLVTLRNALVLDGLLSIVVWSSSDDWLAGRGGRQFNAI